MGRSKDPPTHFSALLMRASRSGEEGGRKVSRLTSLMSCSSAAGRESSALSREIADSISAAVTRVGHIVHPGKKQIGWRRQGRLRCRNESSISPRIYEAVTTLVETSIGTLFVNSRFYSKRIRFRPAVTPYSGPRGPGGLTATALDVWSLCKSSFIIDPMRIGRCPDGSASIGEP